MNNTTKISARQNHKVLVYKGHFGQNKVDQKTYESLEHRCEDILHQTEASDSSKRGCEES